MHRKNREKITTWFRTIRNLMEIKLPFPLKPFGVDASGIKVVPLKVSRFFLINYSYIVIDEASQEAVIIDPAWEFSRISDYITDSGIRLKGVLLTHSHFDHSHLADRMAKKFDCPVFMSEQEAAYSRLRCRGLTLFDGWIDVTVGAAEIVPHATPGHTWGSVCYGIGGNLFSGDTLFNEGCGICLGPGANPKDLFRSLQYLKKNVAAATRVFPGHVYVTDIGLSFGELSNTNIYLDFEDADRFVAFRMRKGQKGLLSFR
jgi:hydroxyacylglutathione hydrolase